MKTMRILPAVVLTAGIAVAAPADAAPAAAASPAVSPDDPPPELPVSVLATIEVASDSQPALGIAPFADGMAVIVNEQTGPPATAYYIGNDGTTSAPMAVPLIGHTITAGPEHVVYGSLIDGTLPERSVGAVAFSGGRTGEVISAAVDPNDVSEFSQNSYAATPRGLVVVGLGGDPLMGLVAPDGTQLTADAVPPGLTGGHIIRTRRSVIDLDRPQAWPLRVDFTGEQTELDVRLPVASAAGSVVWPVSLPGSEPGSPLRVLAVLRAGAEGATWYSLPDGWYHGGSSVWGTALYRYDEAAGTFDVARVDEAVLAGAEGAPAGAYEPDCPRYVEHTAEEFPFRVCETSPAIRNIQWLLVNHFGFDLVVDGEYGSRTEAAIAKFQLDHDLEVDGLAGPATWAALSGEPDTPPWTWRIPSTTTTTTPGDVVVTCDDYVDAPESYPVQPCTTGSGVFAIQVALIVASDYELELAADGYYGQATARAVADFQRRSDLPVTGEVDRATWLALDAGGGADRVDRDGSGIIDPWEWTIESSEPVE